METTVNFERQSNYQYYLSSSVL